MIPFLQEPHYLHAKHMYEITKVSFAQLITVKYFFAS